MLVLVVKQTTGECIPTKVRQINITGERRWGGTGGKSEVNKGRTTHGKKGERMKKGRGTKRGDGCNRGGVERDR